MSIATRKGDGGTTSLLFGRRVSKTHPRVEACGCIDELNAALGLAVAASGEPQLREWIAEIQRQLVQAMALVATGMEDRERLFARRSDPVGPEMVGWLDRRVDDLEGRGLSFEGWAFPGGAPAAAALDVARTICRRAERRVCGLFEEHGEDHPRLLGYLNRLSDVLWLLARWDEAGRPPKAG